MITERCRGVLRAAVALLLFPARVGAQDVRVGVPGRVDVNPYFGIDIADTRLRQVLTSTDRQFLLAFVVSAARGVGIGEFSDSGPPAELGAVAAERLATLRSFDVADSVHHLLALSGDAARLTESSAGFAPLWGAFHYYDYAFQLRTLSGAEALRAALDSIGRGADHLAAAELYLRSLGPEAADSLRDRFLTAATDDLRGRYFHAMLVVGAPSCIPVLQAVLARGAGAYGDVGGSEDEAALGLLHVGTLDAVLALRDALAEAENLGTYASMRLRFGYDAVASWRRERVPDLTGHTIDEWIDILSRPTEPPPVAAQANPSPQVWNLRWRKDVPSSQAQVSIEVGNIAGGRDPRTLVLASIRLNGAMGAMGLRPHDQGNSRWTGPWVDVVFRQRDAIELVPLGAKPGDSFAATLTGTLGDGTRITAPVTIRLVGP